MLCIRGLAALSVVAVITVVMDAGIAKDLRDIGNGHIIPDEGYCDQPYVVVTQDGNWLCLLTTAKGLVVTTTERGTIRIEMSDGKNSGLWHCDRNILKPGMRHHVAIIVDGGPRVISFLIDGILCDGGSDSPYGWGRFSPQLDEVNGSANYGSPQH